jgi:hypothetical protein
MGGAENDLAHDVPKIRMTCDSMHEAEQGSITLRIGKVSRVCVTTASGEEMPNSTSLEADFEPFEPFDAYLEATRRRSTH